MNLIDIFKDEQLAEQYEGNQKIIEELMSSRKDLFSITTQMDLDIELEKLHNVKRIIDICLGTIESLLTNNSIILRNKKENLKNEKIIKGVSWDSTNASLRSELTARDFEKRRERYLINNFKELEEELLDIQGTVDILKYLYNDQNRMRDLVNDIYMSLKKKYDGINKYNFT